MARTNMTAVRAIAGRDLRLVRRSRAVLVPIIVVPMVLLLAPPLALLPAARSPEIVAAELQPLLTRVGSTVGPTSMEPGQHAVVLLLVYVLAPLFLLVPIMVASVTAADSIVGERERGTLEGLLHGPTTDRELFLGKVAAPWIVAMLVTLISAGCYTVVANFVLGAYGLPPVFPNRVWTVLILWVAPAAAGVGLTLIVLISARVKTFQEASQISGIVVVPVVGLVIAQVTGLLLFDVAPLVGLGCGLWLLTLLLVRFAVRRFRRDRLITGN